MTNQAALWTLDRVVRQSCSGSKVRHCSSYHEEILGKQAGGEEINVDRAVHNTATRTGTGGTDSSTLAGQEYK